MSVVDGHIINGKQTNVYKEIRSITFTNQGHDMRTCMTSIVNVPSDLIQLRDMLYKNTSRKYTEYIKLMAL